MLSVLDLFRIGIGPSSSHTVGPIRIASRFVRRLARQGQLEEVASIKVELQGSLALTGVGHATPKAVLLGLMGLEPETLDPADADAQVTRAYEAKSVTLNGHHEIIFDPDKHIVFAYDVLPKLHPNGIGLTAYNLAGDALEARTYYSTGGGFVASEEQMLKPVQDDLVAMDKSVPFPFGSAAELLAHCDANKLAIHDIILANEDTKRTRTDTDAALGRIIDVMMACIDRGLETQGILPGGLEVKRRAPSIWEKLREAPQSNEREQLFDWLNVYAMAVNEENAAGGQVVTAPTNGAAGIIPSVIRHYCLGEEQASKRRKFLLTAARWQQAAWQRYGARRPCKWRALRRSVWSIIWD